MRKIQIDSIFNINTMPFSINLVEIEEIYNNWHKDLKLVYVLKGEIEITLGELRYKLKEDQFYLINSYDFFSIENISPVNAYFLEVIVDCSYFNKYYKDFSFFNFGCFSEDKMFSEDKFNKIRYLISELLSEIFSEKLDKSISILNLINNIVLYLINNFKSSFNKSNKNITNKNRLIKILNYLEENYTNYELSINDISNHIKLNPQYTLRLFKSSFNIGLFKFLNTLRIKKSLSELIYSDSSILEIAINNGFNDRNSYYRLFQEEFKISPTLYREHHKNNSIVKQDYIEKKDLFSKILKYTESNSNTSVSSIKYNTEIKVLDVDMMLEEKNKITHFWKKILFLGRAYEGLKSDIQHQIKKVTKEIGFEYIKIHSIFSDEMAIYNEDEEGNAYYNYIYIDKLIDFFLSINLKPYIVVGFMPNKLSTKNQNIYSNVNVSYPKSINKWNNLVGSLTKYLVSKYGKEEVYSWYFEIWNNPDFFGVFWHETNEKYFIFFEETFETIKSIDAKIKVGGPSTLSSQNELWNIDFLKFLKKSNIKLDFYSFHNYGIRGTEDKLLTNKDRKEGYFKFLKYEPLKDSIKLVKNRLKKFYFENIELIVSEWNSSPYYLDLVHDTCYMNTFILKNVVNNYNSISALAYCYFTDSFEENFSGSNVFFGGLGFISKNNLLKTQYNTFLLLKKLGNKIIAKGENYFITKKDNSYQILLYNYVHYNKNYEDGNLDLINNLDRYKIFREEKPIEIFLKLSKLIVGKYKITRYYLNRESGSIYDAWIEIGAPEEFTEEVYKYLESREKMKMKIENKNLESETIIKEVLNSHEVVCIIIEKIED